MPDLFESYYQYYYLVIILQGICVFHAIRKGHQNKWIWIIVFLPLVGSMAYLFTEVIRKRDVSTLQTGVSQLVNPGGRIRQLEKKFRFSDTFANRVALADAYLDQGQHDKAIELYEPALSGVFQQNEHVIKQLIQAYYEAGRYGDVIRLAPRVTGTLHFSKTRANLLYALALEKTGAHIQAEKEFQAMNHRFSNYEHRYHYGCFLLNRERHEEAAGVFGEILDEADHLTRVEKTQARTWISKTAETWKKLETKL